VRKRPFRMNNRARAPARIAVQLIARNGPARWPQQAFTTGVPMMTIPRKQGVRSMWERAQLQPYIGNPRPHTAEVWKFHSV
jgi:hypothetical protein